MTPRRILVVKTSSMGDIVHALPAVTDIRRHLPQVQIDWLLEKSFASIPALHPAVGQVWPMAWRKWRRALWQAETWHAMGELRRGLRHAHYDCVLDLQGLLKSALWARQAGSPCMGYDRHSIREPLASALYAGVAPVSRDLHAIDRCRRLVAAHLGWAAPESPPDFGIRAPQGDWLAPERRVVLIPCASRPEKFWPIGRWRQVLQACEARGLTAVVLWGNELEQRNAQEIAAGSSAVVPPFLSIRDTAAVLGGAALIVGLDTGFTHLGAAMAVPTVGIYCDHEPGLTGVTGSAFMRSFGGVGQCPATHDVLQAVHEALGPG
jgi:heptosyltransferase-1